MTTSDAGMEMLKRFEGIGGKPVLKAYWDYKGYSIGYGHLGAQKVFLQVRGRQRHQPLVVVLASHAVEHHRGSQHEDSDSGTKHH